MNKGYTGREMMERAAERSAIYIPAGELIRLSGNIRQILYTLHQRVHRLSSCTHCPKNNLNPRIENRAFQLSQLERMQLYLSGFCLTFPTITCSVLMIRFRLFFGRGRDCGESDPYSINCTVLHG